MKSLLFFFRTSLPGHPISLKVFYLCLCSCLFSYSLPGSEAFRFPYLVYYGKDLKQDRFREFHTIVLDPDHYPDVSGFPSRTLGYISVGEVENFREHFKQANELGILGEINPNWPESRFVSLKDDAWQKMVTEALIPKILSKGYQGIFLDTVDSLLFTHKDQQKVLNFLKAIRDSFPRIHIQMNRGLEIAERAAVNSILLETTITSHDFKTGHNSLLSGGSPLKFPDHLEIFSLDYWDPSDPGAHRTIYEIAASRGYKPLVSDIQLHSMPRVLRATDGTYMDGKDGKVFNPKIQRKILALYDSSAGEKSDANPIHNFLEVILNYYGYYCEYRDIRSLGDKPVEMPILLWIRNGAEFEKPIGFLNWLSDQKDRGNPILWFGSIPGMNPWKDKKGSKEVSDLVAENFGFRPTLLHSDSTLGIQIQGDPSLIDYESEMNPLTLGIFKEFEPIEDGIERILTLINAEGVKTYPVFKTSWGIFAQGDMILFTRYNKTKWLLNPYLLAEKALSTRYPIPETTTISGKRIFYAHIDGDGATSKSSFCRGKLNIECMLTLLNQFPVRTGISLIGGEMDRRLLGTDRIRRAARDLMAHPLVEPATHTYSHPFDWEKGIVAMSLDPKAQKAPWGKGSALRLPDGKIDMELESTGSFEVLSKLIPKSKSMNMVYWSGECNPTESQIAYLDKHGIANMNGGDSFFDRQHPSLSYVKPLSRMVGEHRQIYSSNANENVYTHLWTRMFWGFSRVLETFENTGKPKRIKPINVYYHFYSLEKHPSYRALQKIFQNLDHQKGDLINIYPSRFFKIAKNFFQVEIEQLGMNKFRITNAVDLKDFRFPGDVLIRGQNIEGTYYDAGQDVTYFRIGPEADAEVEISDPGNT